MVLGYRPKVPVIPVNLRPVVLGLIEQEAIRGGVQTIHLEEHGDITISVEEGETFFRFAKYDRLFILKKDGVLVEKVRIPDPKALNVTDPLSIELLRLMKEDNFPEGQGESMVMPYGEEGTCILTRTPVGVICNFITDDTTLIYDLRAMRIRPYIKERKRDNAFRRDEMIRKEKERLEAAPSPVEQLGYQGEVEIVDCKVFKNKLTCECGNVRWIKNADVFQVKKCKPCSLQARKGSRNKSRRKKGEQEGV